MTAVNDSTKKEIVTMANVQTVTLNNGIEMPCEGFGVFQVPPT